MIRLTVGNQRGGVGKTTTAITLSALWAERGMRVLLVDADPQGSIGTLVGAGKPELYLNDFWWHNRILSDCIVHPRANVDLLCSNRDTLAAEQRAIGAIARERCLESVFKPVEDRYDAIVIDVGPSLSLLQYCSLYYTRDYLIPVSMDLLSIAGATGFIGTAKLLEEQCQRPCRCIGLLPTILDHRYQNTEAVLRMLTSLSEAKGIALWHGIRTDSTVSKSMRLRKFLAEIDPKAKSLEDYRIVSEQILQMYDLGKSNAQATSAA